MILRSGNSAYSRIASGGLKKYEFMLATSIYATSGRCWLSRAPSSSDHYQTLGLPKNATAKDIKAAYYELSKKYHPDRNKEENSVEKFQKITEAYEVLGTLETKKAYDLTILRSTPPSMTSIRRSGTPSDDASQPKSYTDLDIDYKDFEHFQRSTRQRRVYKQTPESFAAEFPHFKNDKPTGQGEDSTFARTIYRNERALERELEERRIAEELFRRERQAQHPTPTFEKLCRQKEQAEAKDSRQNLFTVIFFVVGTVVVGSCIAFPIR